MLSTDVDLVARGAAAALLLLSLTRLLAVAFFLLAVVGYLVCSAPGAPIRSRWRVDRLARLSTENNRTRPSLTASNASMIIET
jgi:hypothetical protein